MTHSHPSLWDRMHTRYQHDPRYFSDDARWVFFVITILLVVIIWSVPTLRAARADSIISLVLWTVYLPIRMVVRERRGSPAALVWADTLAMGVNLYWWHWLPVAIPLLSVIVCWEAIWSLSLPGALLIGGTFSLFYVAVNLLNHPSLPSILSTIVVAPFYPLLTLLSYYLHRQLTHATTLATHDALTGLWNRRGLPEYASRFENDGYWVAMLDLDDFKSINDRHGHVVGDQVLRAVATVLTQKSGPQAVASRYGGEEFCLLLPPQSADKVITLLTNVLESITNMVPVPFVHVTISGGLAHAQPGESLTETIVRADRALYQAKNSGKNQCHWITEDSQQTWVIPGHNIPIIS